MLLSIQIGNLTNVVTDGYMLIRLCMQTKRHDIILDVQAYLIIYNRLLEISSDLNDV